MIARICVVLLLCLTACAGNERLDPLTTSADNTYRLGAGDEVRVIVFGLDAVSNVYRLSDAGTIALPLLETVDAKGRSTRELEQLLNEAIRAKGLVKNPGVSVQVQKYRPFYILGEVTRPGQYEYTPGMTVLSAVSVAGGYTFRAGRKSVVITRNLDGTPRRGTARPEAVVQPGDTITVPEAWF